VLLFIQNLTIDNQQRFGGMNFDHMPYTNGPQFSNPWSSASSWTSKGAVWLLLELNLQRLYERSSFCGTSQQNTVVPGVASSCSTDTIHFEDTGED
jgi:hypothetical protein